jgi:hypothetical protein
MPLDIASTAPAPKISTGIQSGNTSNDSNTPPLANPMSTPHLLPLACSVWAFPAAIQ